MSDKKKTGRPPLSENEKTVHLTASVPESYKAFVEKYGSGSMSAGVRRLVKEKLFHLDPRCGGHAICKGIQMVPESWRGALGRDYTIIYDCPKCGSFIEPADSQKLKDAGLMPNESTEGE